MNQELKIVGKRLTKMDALAKVLGEAKFTTDLKRPGMLSGKALYAKYPHALVKGIDVSKAAAMEGVVAVLTAKDLPGRNLYGMYCPDKPVIADVKTRYEGDIMAMVAAVDDVTARRALQLIEVEYELLPVYDDPYEAMKDDAVLIHETHPLQEKGNRLQTVVIDSGDIKKAFAEADIVIENEFKTQMADHCYMEPDACLAEIDPIKGGLTLTTGQQIIGQAHRALAPVFGLPQNKVRVISPILGGGFGGKECASNDVAIIAGLLALKTRKPVYVELSREEVFRTTGKRHGSCIKSRLAATKDGKIIGLDVDFVMDKGAYASASGGRHPSSLVVMRAVERSAGAYVIPNAKVRGAAVFTNHAYATAFRAFGAPQTTYAIECQLDELARRLNMDPIELRLKNILRAGDKTIYGQIMKEESGLGLEECIAKARTGIGWDKPFDRGTGKIRRGRGFAAMMYGFNAPAPSEGAGCYANLEQDGTLTVATGLSEMGTGLMSVFAQIAAETMGVRYEDVAITFSDTNSSPEAGPTAASRGVAVGGNAVLDACRQIRERLAKVAAGMFTVAPEDIMFENGRVFVKNDPDKSQPLSAVAVKAYVSQIPLAAYGTFYPPQPVWRAEDGQGSPHASYTFGAHAIEVEVDTETGVVNVTKSILAMDVGKAINPTNVEAQMEGAVGQSLGWSVMEETIFNNGVLQNDAFHNYLIPTFKDVPDLESIIVEYPNAFGPFGAKGVGEPPMVGTAPAIRNAIYDALGIKINTLPLTAMEVLAAIKADAEKAR